MSEDDVVFTSNIAHHSSYIWETKKILEEYSKLESFEELKDRVLEDNILNKSSESYRKEILKEISRRYIPEKEEYKETPLLKAINSDLADYEKEWIIYYEFSKDDLVYHLITNFIYYKYSQGATYIDKEEIVEYLNDLEEDHPEIQDWSEYTILQVAEHILSALKNFGVLEGSKKKKFKYISPPNQVIVYTLYSLLENGIERSKDIIDHDDWKLFMFNEDSVRNKLSNISPEFIRYEKRGSVEKIEPKYDSLEDVIDEF